MGSAGCALRAGYRLRTLGEMRPRACARDEAAENPRPAARVRVARRRATLVAVGLEPATHELDAGAGRNRNEAHVDLGGRVALRRDHPLTRLRSAFPA